MASDGRKTPRPLYSSTGLAIGPAAIETVRLAMKGLSNQEIADRRHCSLHTVNNQLKLFYDVARQTIEDDAFWNAHSNPSRRRNALPLIWERMLPYLGRFVDEDATPASTPPHTSVAELADLPTPRCHTFWGRAAFIEETCRAWRDSTSARIVLLAAFGGYGKTECARAIAEQLLREQRFGNLAWIDLNNDQGSFHPDSEPTMPLNNRQSLTTLARTILSRLAVASESELHRQLQAEATLIVVDGLESVEGIERRAVVDALHRWIGSGPSQALITSRVDVVAPYLDRPAFPGLDLPATEVLLRGEAARVPQAAQFRDASASVIEHIWRLTLGMPLALHQVIGQCQHYELRQVIAHLEDARTHGSSDAFYAFLCQPAWQELSREARALLVYMSVATREPQTSRQLEGLSIAAGIAFDQASLGYALAELTTWFLVQRALPQIAEDEPTYTLHPTTRGFVRSAGMRERWTAELGIDEGGLIDAATRKHEEIIDLTIGTPGGEVGRNMTLFPPSVLDLTLARSIPDMLHVARAHLQRGNDGRVLWYWESITGYLWYFGRFHEFAECDEYALVAARRIAETNPVTGERLIGIISAELGYAAMESDEPERAEEYFRDALNMFETLGDRAEAVRVLRYQASLRLRTGEFDAAKRLCREALDRLDLVDWDTPLDADDQRSIMRSPIHNLLGSIYLQQQQHGAARREVVTALRMARSISGDHRYWSLSPTVNLGRIHEHAGRDNRATRYYQRCIRLTEDGSNPDARADALVRLATLATDSTLAQQLVREAIALYEAMGKRAEAARVRAAIMR